MTNLIPKPFCGFASQICGLILLLAGTSHAYVLVVSPQVGTSVGSGPGLLVGTTISGYPEKGGFGIGAGGYLYRYSTELELLAKFSVGIGGISVGPIIRGGNYGVTLDAWGSLMYLGLRYKFDRAGGKSTHSLLLFVPLCWPESGSGCHDALMNNIPI